MEYIRTKLIVFLLPAAIFVMFLVIKVWFPYAYDTMVQEDAIIEYIQFGLYLAAAIASFLIATKFFGSGLLSHGILYSLLCLTLTFVAIEEISWGQRIADIETPNYFTQHNTQGEISIHNLSSFQSHLSVAYMLVGLYGTLSWIFAKSIKLNKDHVFNFVVPEWYLSTYFFPVAFVYGYFEIIGQLTSFTSMRSGFVVWRDQEPAEFLLSMGFLFFVLVNHRKARLLVRSQPTSATESAIDNLR